MKDSMTETKAHTNPDLITKAPGSHPGATAIGAASGAGSGAAIGSIGGPVGAVIGAVAGGIIGGAMGHGIGEWNDPSDAAYWKDEYRNRDYYDQSADYDRDVVPALQYGTSLAATERPVTSESLEALTTREWEKVRGTSRYTYKQARAAINDAYNRKLEQHREQMQVTASAGSRR